MIKTFVVLFLLLSIVSCGQSPSSSGRSDRDDGPSCQVGGNEYNYLKWSLSRFPLVIDVPLDQADAYQDLLDSTDIWNDEMRQYTAKAFEVRQSTFISQDGIDESVLRGKCREGGNSNATCNAYSLAQLLNHFGPIKIEDYLTDAYFVLSQPVAWPLGLGDNKTLAITVFSYMPNNCELHHADIVFNSNISGVSFGDTIQSGQYHFKSVLVHELGHFLGLKHCSHTDSIMATTIGRGVKKTNLTSYEKDILYRLYGEGDFNIECCSPRTVRECDNGISRGHQVCDDSGVFYSKCI